MPNPFSINIVTPDGAALIAQATAANQIVFTAALSGTTAATDAADLAIKTAAFYDGITGTINACSATGTTARIVAAFGNAGSSSQAVKSVCILGRLASQSAGSEVIVAAMSDDASMIVLPPDSSPSQKIRFPFNFAVTDGGTIETVYADGATLSDLERFVSMHKAGDPTQGEDQTIKGDKTFDDYCYFNDNVIFQKSIMVNSDGSVFSGFESVGDVKIGSDAENPANLTVYGACNLYDAVTCRNNITTIGDADIGNDLLVNGSTTLLGDLDCDNISCSGITGLAPSGATGRKTIPVGGIIAVCPSGVSGWGSNKDPTTTIMVNDGTILPIAEWSCEHGRFDGSSYSIGNGTYMLLTGWNYGNTQTSTYGIVFLIRTA